MNRLVAMLLALTIAVPAAAQPPRKLGRVLMTFYWIVDESAPRYAGHATAALRDAHGRLIARTSPRFARDVMMEGAGWLRDGRTVVYDCTVRGRKVFRLTNLRYGAASTGCALAPYRTVAVDRRVVPLGSTIYIPQLKGARLPDGHLHDGLFKAVDHGTFRGRHVDVFVGAGPASAHPFIAKGFHSRSRVTMYVLDREETSTPLQTASLGY